MFPATSLGDNIESIVRKHHQRDYFVALVMQQQQSVVHPQDTHCALNATVCGEEENSLDLSLSSSSWTPVDDDNDDTITIPFSCIPNQEEINVDWWTKEWEDLCSFT